MKRRRLPLVLLALLALGCVRPCASCRIGSYVHRGVETFMKDAALKPKAVLEEDGGRTYVFEVVEAGEAPRPPAGPVVAGNLENAVPPVQLHPDRSGPLLGQPARVVPGAPRDTPVGRDAVTDVRILRVRTAPDGTILGYTCSGRQVVP